MVVNRDAKLTLLCSLSQSEMELLTHQSAIGDENHPLQWGELKIKTEEGAPEEITNTTKVFHIVPSGYKSREF